MFFKIFIIHLTQRQEVQDKELNVACLSCRHKGDNHIRSRQKVFGEDIKVSEVTVKCTTEQLSNLCGFGGKSRSQALFGLALALYLYLLSGYLYYHYHSWFRLSQIKTELCRHSILLIQDTHPLQGAYGLELNIKDKIWKDNRGISNTKQRTQ